MRIPSKRRTQLELAISYELGDNSIKAWKNASFRTEMVPRSQSEFDFREVDLSGVYCIDEN